MEWILIIVPLMTLSVGILCCITLLPCFIHGNYLMWWVRISIRTRCTALYDKVFLWLATARWFSPGPTVCSTNKTDHHDITEILLKRSVSYWDRSYQIASIISRYKFDNSSTRCSVSTLLWLIVPNNIYHIEAQVRQQLNAMFGVYLIVIDRT
jgi:hypothetical protein